MEVEEKSLKKCKISTLHSASADDIIKVGTSVFMQNKPILSNINL